MNDIIFALATSNLRSALHLHRLSGNGVFELLSPYIFLPHSENHLDLNALIKNTNAKPITRYVIIKDQEKNIIDDVMLTLFLNPRSFTGEDVIEISTHGNPLISLQLHSLLRKIGMRDAKPGEFTQRALLNGKLDLAQAEGINQLIHAESMGAITLARNNVEGLLSKETLQIRESILELLAYLEAHIDFAPDEVGDYQPQHLLPKTEQIKNRLTSLFKTYENGLKIREGVKIVLCGKPNAGKSSLYNAFLKHEKAIVTNIPGTTRDVLEDKLLINNKEFVLLDTAGIRATSSTEDEVEKIGITRTFSSMKQADIICYLISAHNLSESNYVQQIENEISTIHIEDKQKLIIVLTKKDLLTPDSLDALSKISLQCKHDILQQVVIIDQFNFKSLEEQLLAYYSEILEKTDTKNSPMLISQRQKDKVTLALQTIDEAEKLILVGDFPEKIASLMNLTKSALEEIVGEISVDNVFEKVFSTFCIGK